jgi:hypothetical protein
MDRNLLAKELVKLAKVVSAGPDNPFKQLKIILDAATELHKSGQNFLAGVDEDEYISPKDKKRIKLLGREIMSRASLIQNAVGDTDWLVKQVNDIIPL